MEGVKNNHAHVPDNFLLNNVTDMIRCEILLPDGIVFNFIGLFFWGGVIRIGRGGKGIVFEWVQKISCNAFRRRLRTNCCICKVYLKIDTFYFFHNSKF